MGKREKEPKAFPEYDEAAQIGFAAAPDRPKDGALRGDAEEADYTERYYRMDK